MSDERSNRQLLNDFEDITNRISQSYKIGSELDPERNEQNKLYKEIQKRNLNIKGEKVDGEIYITIKTD